MEETKTGAATAAHAANEKAVQDQKSAATGAQAVAEAVKRVADAAVNEISKSKSGQPVGDFRASGTPGGQFVLEAPTQGVFSSSGTVLIGKQQLHTTEWSSQRIVGTLPAGTKAGEIEVHIGGGVVRREYLNI